MGTAAISPTSSSSAASVPSTTVSNLLQTLQNVDGSVASSPALAAALEKAPASDIVQLSVAATQLQNIGSLFGTASDSSNPFTSGTNNSDFANLESVLTGSSATDPTSQAALSATQLQNVDSLFGIQSTSASTTTDPLSNLESLVAGPSASGASSTALDAITNALTASSSTGSTSQAAQVAEFQQQIQNTQSLFGIGSSVSTAGGNLNLLG